MVIERSCVHRFIAQSQTSFENGAKLEDVIGNVERYQALVERAYGPIKNPLHRLFTSHSGLSTLARYEYLRYRDAPLPDSNDIIQTIWPLKRRLRLMLFGGDDIFDIRPMYIDHLDQLEPMWTVGESNS